jgi:hypothetical protein
MMLAVTDSPNIHTLSSTPDIGETKLKLATTLGE